MIPTLKLIFHTARQTSYLFGHLSDCLSYLSFSFILSAVQQIFNQRLPLAANQVRLELTNQNQPSVKSMSQSLLQQQLVQNNANYFSQNKSVVQPQSNQVSDGAMLRVFQSSSLMHNESD